MLSYMNKVLITGDSNVGKTSLLNVFGGESFSEEYSQTIISSFKRIPYSTAERTVNLNIWDVCGAQKYSNLSKQYFKSIDLAVLVFDLTNHQSFEKLKDLATSITQSAERIQPFFLVVGNKSDLSDQNSVPQEEIDEFIAPYMCKYYAISVKENSEINNLFHEIGRICISKLNGAHAPTNNIPSATPSPPQPVNTIETDDSGSCCFIQ